MKSESIHGFKVQIRRLVEPIAKFECECCGRQVKRAGKFEFRSPQYVIDHLGPLLTVCRMCIYKLSFGTVGIMKRKRENQVENESYKYASID